MGPGGFAYDGEAIPNGVQGVAPRTRLRNDTIGPFPMRGEA